MFDKLFGRSKRSPEQRPGISFGRYSDNNKPVEKVARWTDADNLFKDKKYHDSIEAFLDYIRDEAADNVKVTRNGTDIDFRIFQGSKIVRGKCNAEHLQAEVSLAKMPQPSVAVMRRLLEQNFSLFYSRYSLDGNRLCMRFDSDVPSANPNRLYYALKELATKADKQDDLLVNDFTSLESLDTDHMIAIPDAEKETKFAFMQKWIGETLALCEGFDKDKFSGAIAYLLLALSFRIDYLIGPEGALQSELEKIPIIYFAKDERPTMAKNNDMLDAFRKLQAKPKEEFFKNLFRNKSCFAISAPQTQKVIGDSILGANNNMIWYRDNNYPSVAQQICEYGISYCQYSYSMPKVMSQLFELFMQINYPEYFISLGFTEIYYDDAKKKFDADDIIDRIMEIQNAWKKKFPLMDFKVNNLKFDNMVNFNNSFATELQLLNLDAK
jgi:hypothetical protein